jgi:uncharacterized protein (DUF342 family)
MALAEAAVVPEGRPGFDVRGQPLAVEAGEALTITHDDSVKEIPLKTGKRLLAARSGELRFDGKQLRIATLQGIQGDVGADTGNINFAGEVRITGKVHPGFTVIGGQNVLIAGNVESALISAGGKVVIVRGVQGVGKGVVRARNTIEIGAAERATLMAVEDIKVKNSCTFCNIKTNGRLFLAGEMGNLVGGVCKARRGVNALNVGAEKDSRTEISFGQDYLVKDQIEVTEGEIEKIRAALIELEKKIKQLEHIPSSLAAARGEKVKFMKMLEQLNLKVFTLREKFEEHHESEIRIRGTVHPGVVMESQDRYYEVKQKRDRVIFYFDRTTGRIMEKNL